MADCNKRRSIPEIISAIRDRADWCHNNHSSKTNEDWEWLSGWLCGTADALRDANEEREHDVDVLKHMAGSVIDRAIALRDSIDPESSEENKRIYTDLMFVTVGLGSILAYIKDPPRNCEHKEEEE